MEEEILNKIFKQNCGDSLLVLEKIKPEGSVRWLYRCQFQKYPCEVICQKGHILRGNINNPKINEYILVAIGISEIFSNLLLRVKFVSGMDSKCNINLSKSGYFLK